MTLTVNGETMRVAAATLATLLDELGYGPALVATALNQEFVPQGERAGTALREGDRVEIVAPMKGG